MRRRKDLQSLPRTPYPLRVKWVQVSKENVTKGTPGCPGHCAIARSLLRVIMPPFRTEVGRTELVIFLRGKPFFRRRLPQKAVKWIERYDSDDRATRATCKPFEFPIVLPEAVLAEAKG